MLFPRSLLFLPILAAAASHSPLSSKLAHAIRANGSLFNFNFTLPSVSLAITLPENSDAAEPSSAEGAYGALERTTTTVTSTQTCITTLTQRPETSATHLPLSRLLYLPNSTVTTGNGDSISQTTSLSKPGNDSYFGSGKRGLAYNEVSLTYPFSGLSDTSWAYNWASSPAGDLPSNLEYIPMLWNLNPDATAAWFSGASSAIMSGSKHLFAFNEPDIDMQANITPVEAAAGYITYLNPFSGQAELGSPAVTNAGGSLGLAWLSSFFSACDGQCIVDFVNVHWYDSAENVAYFKSFVADAITLAQVNGVNKVWITEFKGGGTLDQQTHFLEVVLPWLDSEDLVEAYAWFMCGTGEGDLLINNSTKSSLGQLYS